MARLGCGLSVFLILESNANKLRSLNSSKSHTLHHIAYIYKQFDSLTFAIKKKAQLRCLLVIH